MFDAPQNQDDGNAQSGENTSPENTSGDTDGDSDIAGLVNTLNQAVAADPLPKIQPAGNLPNTGSKTKHQVNSGSRSVSGSAAGKNAGIAFAVIGLIAVVVVGAVFAVRKYRRGPMIPIIRISDHE